MDSSSKGLNFLYSNIFGRIILKVMTTKTIANLYAKYMNSKLSTRKIKKFIKKNNINMDEYVNRNYTSFNDFFMREIKKGKRVVGEGIISPCDSRVLAYKLDDNSSFKIKSSIYTVDELTKENKKYKYALIFRLCVDDYHHYAYPDDGEVISTKYINGVLHTVQPIAHKKYKVFHENSRCVTFLKCKNLGEVCYIEVGAMMIGKIVNIKKDKFKKGEEKGHFEFGGSTVILLIDKDIKIREDILNNSNNEIETVVKMGESIGR